MSNKFLQIHNLTSYTAALLNRDDTGLAKRLSFGGFSRTRISSQCLKRHWRLADDPHAIGQIDGQGAAFRSRDLVTKKVIGELSAFPEDIRAAIEPFFQMTLYGEKAQDKKSRQTLLFGEAELAWLAQQAKNLAEKANGDVSAAKELAKEWNKSNKDNLKAITDTTSIPGGIVGALFGRMVTSDPGANITAPVHVAHSFTVHEEESESDYFTAVDDLASESESGADTIQATELNCGLFYGYVVIDIQGLRDNLGGDEKMAGQILHNLVYLIAETSPGAKLGSTAPYGRAGMMLLEVGDRQPRSLAEAFREPCAPSMPAAEGEIKEYLKKLDGVYETKEDRRSMSLNGIEYPRATSLSLAELANWTKSLA